MIVNLQSIVRFYKKNNFFELTKKINKKIKYYGKDIVIHLAGEFTLCYALLKRFREQNITCIASCTEIYVEDNGNGEDVVTFEFVQFREYE